MDYITLFITFTTYGTWVPGDERGWRKTRRGNQTPQPLLADWCRDRMTDTPVILNQIQREKVKDVCCRHAEIRKWTIYAINVRTNHVHIAISANAPPKMVLSQLKANSTRVLRQEPESLERDRIWTKGGDCQLIDEESLEEVVYYVTEAQDHVK